MATPRPGGRTTGRRVSSPLPPSAHPVPKLTARATRDLVRAQSSVNHKVPEVGLALLEAADLTGQPATVRVVAVGSGRGTAVLCQPGGWPVGVPASAVVNVGLICALAILAAPLAWVLGLGLLHVARKVAQRSLQHPPPGWTSVDEIVARVEAERAADRRSPPEPVAGYVPGVYRARDEPLLSDELYDRPTAEFPAIRRTSKALGRKPRPYPLPEERGPQNRR